MKKNVIYSFIIAIASFAFMACSNDDDGNQMRIPDSAKPSAKFTFGNFENEQYANDAVKMDVTNWNNGSTAPEFKSIELFADGHFLITKANAGNAPKSKRMATRAIGINGSDDFDNALYIYGTFTREKEGVYRLSNNTRIEIKEGSVVGYTTVTYTNSKGIDITITVNIDINYKPDDAVRQICRSWRMDSQEIWLYTDKAYIGYGKQWIDNFFKVKQDITITPEGKQWGFDEDDILDDDDYCRRVIFSPCGTFMCFYQDGDVEIGRWEWRDKQNGILRCYEPFEFGDDDLDDDDDYMDMTVRFDGKQMLMYNDYMDEENDINYKVYSVSTFSARY